jgi:hypothetical protein
MKWKLNRVENSREKVLGFAKTSVNKNLMSSQSSHTNLHIHISPQALRNKVLTCHESYNLHKEAKYYISTQYNCQWLPKEEAPGFSL